jgi:hypothetical protein
MKKILEKLHTHNKKIFIFFGFYAGKVEIQPLNS